MKKWLIACLVLVLTVISSACGQTTDKTGAAEKSGGGTSSGGSNTIRIITTAGGYPFNATNPDTNTVEGFMIDIINEMAKRIHLKTELSTGDWNSLIPSLQSGKADVIVDGMYITEERKKSINFTDPVFAYGEGLIVPEKDKTTKSIEDLKGKTIGVQMGTSYKDMLEKKDKSLNIQVKTYQTLADILNDIQTGRLDGALADAPSFSYIQSKNPNMKYRIVKDYVPSLTGKIGIGISKQRPELVEKLNGALKEMKDDGTLKKIYQKWGVDWDFK
ncbi:substrate-binding periplasmic protein [Bacillus sp. OTU530]|uniref:substrate-binding periplasmic protein n=1 Tax=Bacillus sp. OTU530 TaxID=3043862 RepID=UPI00313D525F